VSATTPMCPAACAQQSGPKCTWSCVCNSATTCCTLSYWQHQQEAAR
jgi:hypothetical protein